MPHNRLIETLVVCLRFGAVALALYLPRSAQAVFEGEAEVYSPQAGIRLSNGLLVNQGSSGGSATALGGINFYFSYYLSKQVALGLGYTFEFDLKKGTLPLSGYELFGRWYFMGSGTYSRATYPGGYSDRQDTFAAYTGLGIARRTYYIGSTAADEAGTDKEASDLSFNALVGVDYGLSRRFRINLEGSYGLVSLAASNDAVRIRAILGSVGISYVF